MASRGQLDMRRPTRTVSGLKRDLEQQDLATVTLLEALDRDDRPSFAIEVQPYPTYDDPLELIYSNAALRGAEKLLARVTGQDATSVFTESSAAQLAFRNWVYGHVDEGDLQRRGSAYTFEGHIWNAITVGRSKIVSGVPTMYLWVDAAPGGRNNRHPRDGKAQPTPSLPRPESAASACVRPTATQHVSFDYTLDTLPPAIKSNAHIDYFRSVNWADTPLGPLHSWSSDLRCMANMILSNKYPAVLFWGEDVTMLYNEHYVQLLGSLHPCMGKSIRTEAPEHWVSFDPIVDHIKTTGEPVAESDMLLFIDRHGFMEETHWSFQFVPIIDRKGQITAYYQSFYEVTGHRLLERRVSSLVAMGSQSADARDFQSYWDTTLRSLTLNDKDVPFALLYAAERHASAEVPSLLSPGSVPPLARCTLKGAIGVSPNHPIAPTTIDINGDSYVFHPYLRQAAKSGKATIVQLDDLPSSATILQGIKWRGYGDPCRIAIICPILPTTGEQVQGFLILGVNPRRPFDDEYQQFVQVMVRLLATSLASVALFEEEVRQRETAIVQAAQIQEQLLAEIQLKEKKFQRFAERSDVAIFITDAAGTYTYRNQRWYDLFGPASADDNTRDAWSKVASEEDIRHCESLFFEKLYKQYESVCFELRTRIPWTPPSELSKSQAEDAEYFMWILVSAFPELAPNGELVEIVGNVTDIR
jgi:PAS domain-containing protein